MASVPRRSPSCFGRAGSGSRNTPTSRIRPGNRWVSTGDGRAPHPALCRPSHRGVTCNTRHETIPTAAVGSGAAAPSKFVQPSGTPRCWRQWVLPALPGDLFGSRSLPILFDLPMGWEGCAKPSRPGLNVPPRRPIRSARKATPALPSTANSGPDRDLEPSSVLRSVCGLRPQTTGGGGCGGAGGSWARCGRRRRRGQGFPGPNVDACFSF